MKKGRVLSKWRNYQCIYCNKTFKNYVCLRREYCSSSCRSKDGNFGANEKHQGWLGSKVGYWGIHKWIVRHWGQPSTCDNCGKKNLIGRQIHWANLSHKYKRERKDWIRLCQSCHRLYDNGKIKLKVAETN